MAKENELKSVKEEEIKEFPQQTTFNEDDMSIIHDESEKETEEQ